MNCFESGNVFINLFGFGEHEKGLYKNQLGAIGAAMSHFSTRTDPALITMPTGTGKSAVMIVLSYVLTAKKVLVITPSQLVRKQIADGFREPKLLIRNHIISPRHLPTVFELKSEETSKEVWEQILGQNDVCVAIPSTLNKILEAGQPIDPNAFDLIFVDEAHHSRAASWTSILKYFDKAKQILLTATPFRRDKKELQARLIYNYPLKLAYEEGLFSKINFISINREDAQDEAAINIAIAKKAEEVYVNRPFLGHKIIVRTDSKSRAVELSHIYKANTALNLEVIHSGLGDAAIEKRIGALVAGTIDGIICVDMMGEGYDFPALKIAAIHVPHKSLSVTLQFVGRISRTNIPEAKIATVIASEQDFLIEARLLYKDESDWSVILPQLHFDKIAATEDEQNFQDEFTSENLEADDLILDTTEINLELSHLKPFFHVKIYKVFNKIGLGHGNGNEIDPDRIIDIFREIDFAKCSVLSNPFPRAFFHSNENKIAVHVIAQTMLPPWIVENDRVKNIYNELIILYFNEAHNFLFICSTVKETELYEHIMESVLGDAGMHEMIFLPQLKRIMAGWKDERMYNIGMKSRKAKGSHEAYKQILGSFVQKGVLPSDKYGYTRGHSFGGGFDTVLDREVLFGISTSSKVWSLEENKLLYFIKWCNDIARKIGDPEMDALQTPLSELDSGRLIEEFPQDQIFFADWDVDFYAKNTFIGFIDSEGELLAECLLCACQIAVVETALDSLKLRISRNGVSSEINFTVNPVIDFQYVDDTPVKLFLKRREYGSNPDEMLHMLKENPVHVYYENLSFIAGKVYFESRLDISLFELDNLVQTNWPDTVNVKKEFWTEEEFAALPAGVPQTRSIHDFIIDIAKEEADAVFYDHGSLEIADVISFSNGSVKFYHCKKQDGDEPRCSVDDMYEVIGQAVKSVNWSHRKLLMEQLVSRAEKNGSAAKLKKGTINNIRDILSGFENPVISVEIIIVQPGLKSDNHLGNQVAAFERIRTLLSGAQEYLKAVSSCTLKVMCS